MTVMQLADTTDGSLRARWKRWRHVIIPVVAVMFAVGAFLLWGPNGLGNGPLAVEMNATEGWSESVLTPTGFILPMYNSGGSLAVVDSVDLVGGTRYAAPRILALAVLTSALCGAPGLPALRRAALKWSAAGARIAARSLAVVSALPCSASHRAFPLQPRQPRRDRAPAGY